MRRLIPIGCLLILLSGMAGCLLPDYYSPAGFSSTYHRRLRPYYAPVIVQARPLDSVPAASAP